MLLACGGESPEVGVGPACAALRDAAQRGSRCDPILASLAETLQTKPDEAACVAAVRTMLAPGEPAAAGLRSVYEPAAAVSADPLSDAELAQLIQLRRPATLTISPDVGRVPGIPPTLASLDGLALDVDVDGRLSTDVAAGHHTVRLRHAGRDKTWCVHLRDCETLEVVAHGAQLARHPDVSSGRCSTGPGSPVEAE